MFYQRMIDTWKRNSKNYKNVRLLNVLRKQANLLASSKASLHVGAPFCLSFSTL